MDNRNCCNSESSVVFVLAIFKVEKEITRLDEIKSGFWHIWHSCLDNNYKPIVKCYYRYNS